LLLAAGLIGGRSPLIWLMVPTRAWRFTGTVEFYWEWGWHYDAVLMPIAFAALLDALGDRLPGRATLGWAEGPRPAPRLRGAAVGVSAAATRALGRAVPGLDVLRPGQGEPAWRAERAAAALEAVREDAVLAVDITLMAQAVPEDDVQWLQGHNERVPDCML